MANVMLRLRFQIPNRYRHSLWIQRVLCAVEVFDLGHFHPEIK